MKRGLRNFMLSPGFVVLCVLAAVTTGYFFTWQLSLPIRFALGGVAAAGVVALVLFALKNVKPRSKNRGSSP